MIDYDEWITDDSEADVLSRATAQWSTAHDEENDHG